MINSVKRKRVQMALGYYVQDINIGVTKYARNAGWILTDISSRRHSPPTDWQGDGIITLVIDRSQTWLIDYLKKNEFLPIVKIANDLPELDYPVVQPDNWEIGRLAAEELIHRGFRQLGFYSHSLTAQVVQERLQGFMDAASKASLEVIILEYQNYRSSSNSPLDHMKWLEKQLGAISKPVGFMAHYDLEAADLVTAALQGGIQIPNELSVIGVDNDPVYCELGQIPLSSVDSNLETVGYRAAQLLDDMMNGNPRPTSPIRIPPKGVVVRQSSDIFSTDNLAVQKAVYFIRENFMNDLSVEDVVKPSGVSRRILYKLFNEILGCSIQKEINRQKFDYAKMLLSETDFKVRDIAKKCGCSDAMLFSKSFKNFVGESPYHYRNQCH